MLKSQFSILSDFIVLLFIISIFNDGFFVEHFGANILKVIFILFMFCNVHDMIKNIKSMNTWQDRVFFVFIFLITIIFLIQASIDMPYNSIKPILSLISMLVIVLYFSRYPINKLLYFIWIAVLLSITVCYFNDPIDITTFRKTGGTPDANTFATQVLIFILISIYLFYKNKSRVFLAISTFFFLYGIFFAGSKSAFLVFAILIVFVWFRYMLVNFKVFFNYKFILTIIIMLIAVIYVDFTKIEIVSNVLDRTKSSETAEYRFISWKAGQHMIEDNTMLGVGLGRFSENTAKYAEQYDPSYAPHNTYIQLFAEMGIIVFSLFLYFLYVLLTSNFVQIINSNYMWIYFSFVATILMGMTLGLFNWKIQWLIIAVIMNINYLIKLQRNIS